MENNKILRKQLEKSYEIGDQRRLPLNKYGNQKKKKKSYADLQFIKCNTQTFPFKE